MIISEYHNAQPKRTISKRGTVLLWCCFLLIFSNSAKADTRQLNISTDIAPIHSLVSLVVGELSTVDLIIPPNQSPHDFSLKPSQLRALNKADLIVIVSEGFNPSLSRHLQALGAKSKVIDLSSRLNSDDTLIKNSDEHKNDADDTHKNHSEQEHIATGINEQQDEQDHNEASTKEHQDEQEHNAMDSQEQQGQHEHGGVHADEHTWLNPENAITWVRHIAEAASSIDESNRETYERNATNAVTMLTQLHQALQKQLQTVTRVPYIVRHDAYQHFAYAYGLTQPLAIALSDARAPSAAKLRRMRQAAQSHKCIFSEVQHNDAIVATISEGLDLKQAMLDPLGSNIPVGPSLYATLMQNLTQSFADCLTP